MAISLLRSAKGRLGGGEGSKGGGGAYNLSGQQGKDVVVRRRNGGDNIYKDPRQGRARGKGSWEGASVLRKCASVSEGKTNKR